MALSDKEVRSYLTKFYRFLKDGHEFELRKMRGYHGAIYPEEIETTVELDYRQPILSTLVHESLHYIHPEWSETMVLVMEKKLINSFTSIQVRNIIKRFAQAL